MVQIRMLSLNEPILNFIGGEWAPANTSKTLSVYSPATGQIYNSIPDSGIADVERAVLSASRAFIEWRKWRAQDRAEVLRHIAKNIREHLNEFARAESYDNGKPIRLAETVDIPRSAYNFEFFADAATQFSSECHATDFQAINYTLREPLGVVACISPWNLPLYLLSWKVAPALAAGNTVIAKPSEVTPLTAHLLTKIVQKSGLPPGVLNVLHGTGEGIGASLVAHPQIKAVSFTGSTKTGEAIARLAAPAFKKISLEMGGKNPTIIFADCNFEKAVETTLRSAFSNQGQICLCGSRILVEKSIYNKFKEALILKIKTLKVGDPALMDTDQGALVSKDHFDKVMSCIQLAKEEGGTFLTGGRALILGAPLSGGWYMEPTLIEGLSQQCRTNQEEIFGPVATISSFDSEEQALKDANATRYGLAANLWTENISRVQRLSHGLQFGIVWVNTWMMRDLRTPFGGVKDSGVGREGGFEVLRFFTEPKNICISG
jgi:aminomuconate-semialdehyde/2-hydroxymuconate-6-semialdehyde dehydrogenase